MRVIVFGASGGIGRKVVPLLLAAGHSVTAFVRASSNREALDATDATIVVGDALDRSSVDAAFAGGGFDAVICSVGSLPGKKHTDLETNSNIVDAAVAAGVRRFIGVSSIGAGDSWAVAPEAARAYLHEIMALRTKIEDYTMAADLDWTLVRPGGLKDDRPTGNALLTEDHTVAGLVTREDVAARLVDCLADDAIGRIYHVVDADRTYAKS